EADEGDRDPSGDRRRPAVKFSRVQRWLHRTWIQRVQIPRIQVKPVQIPKVELTRVPLPWVHPPLVGPSAFGELGQRRAQPGTHAISPSGWSHEKQATAV